ncbi:MAG: UrcA family protein [Alphaproteobacteria bacterium]
MLRSLFSAAVLVLSVTAAAQAETRQMQVSLADLNLNRPAGQAAAQARIHAAAVQLCGSMRDTMELGGWERLDTASSHGCVARAIEHANAQLALSR